MNYRQIYDSLITRASSRVSSSSFYYEKHHIIPKCQGGRDATDNLILLTPEEHYLAHQLLIKIYPEDSKLIHAAVMMTVGHEGKRITNKLYGWLRRKFSSAMSISQAAEKNNQFGTFWITDGTKSMKAKAEEDIPSGWYKGRVIPAARKHKIVTCIVCGVTIDTVKGKLCAIHLTEARKKHGSNSYSNIKGIYERKVFITNGVHEKLHPMNESVPDTYWRGRKYRKSVN